MDEKAITLQDAVTIGRRILVEFVGRPHETAMVMGILPDRLELYHRSKGGQARFEVIEVREISSVFDVKRGKCLWRNHDATKKR